MLALAPQAIYSPFVMKHFAPTGLSLSFERNELDRRVFIPSNEAKRWDGAAPETNCTVYSERHEVHCYAELRISPRARVRHHGFGVWGTQARVRFTGAEIGLTPGEWHTVVVVS